MLPPLAADLSPTASVEIAAPLFIRKRTAETVIEPASPPPVDLAVICGPASGSTISEATVMLTSPPLPGPAVELAISAPPFTVRLLALTLTEPPAPDCGPIAEAAIWVLATPEPSSTSAPGVVTVTEPPAPVPAVVLMICPPLARAICPAFTLIDPASPIEPELVSVPIRDPDPLSDRRPPTSTATRPLFPVLAGRFIRGRSALDIEPPLTIESAPTWMLTSPAFPELPAREFVAMPDATSGLVPDPSIASKPSTATATVP